MAKTGDSDYGMLWAYSFTLLQSGFTLVELMLGRRNNNGLYLLAQEEGVDAEVFERTDWELKEKRVQDMEQLGAGQ